MGRKKKSNRAKQQNKPAENDTTEEDLSPSETKQKIGIFNKDDVEGGMDSYWGTRFEALTKDGVNFLGQEIKDGDNKKNDQYSCRLRALYKDSLKLRKQAKENKNSFKDGALISETSRALDEREIILEEQRVDEIVTSFLDEGIPFYSEDYDHIECPLCFKIYFNYIEQHVSPSPCCGKFVCKTCHMSWTEEQDVSTQTCSFCRVKLPRNGEEYNEMLVARAEEGKVWAQLQLFHILNNKGGDDQMTRHWLEMAAKQDDFDAMAQLGLYYHEGGLGIQKSNDEAIRLLKTVALRGHSFAQYYLAICLETAGEDEQSLRWSTFCAAQGRPNGFARRRMAELYTYGLLGLNVSLEREIYWLRRALDVEEVSDYFYRKNDSIEKNLCSNLLKLNMNRWFGQYDIRGVSVMSEVFFWGNQSVERGSSDAIEELIKDKKVERESCGCEFCEKDKNQCKDGKTIRCSRCRYRVYCGLECRAKDWERYHKYECFPPVDCCVVCNTNKNTLETKKLQFCIKCKIQGYCSRECQVQDWKKLGHKNLCYGNYK